MFSLSFLFYLISTTAFLLLVPFVQVAYISPALENRSFFIKTVHLVILSPVFANPRWHHIISVLENVK
jgi:hypothetical protein